MTELSLEYVKHATGEFDAEAIFQAVLSNRAIRRIDSLNQCSNLRWLDLSRNAIIRIENLEGLTRLMMLDLSFNKIQKVQNLESLDMLERLKLQSNPISRLDDLDGLRFAGKLKHLHFRNVDNTDFCPVCLQDGYHTKVFELGPTLIALDSKRRHLPDLQSELEKVDGEDDLQLPEAEPWFLPEDLDLKDLQSSDGLDSALQPHVQDFEVAVADCSDVLKEAETLLKGHNLDSA